VEDEQAFSENYKKAYDELIKQGYPARQARRYLDSIAKRNLKKFMKGRSNANRRVLVSNDIENAIEASH
jgi:hypothetical protein